MPPTLWEASGVLWVGRVGVWGLALGSWRFARLVSRAALAVLAVGAAWGLALRRPSRLLLADPICTRFSWRMLGMRERAL